MCANQGRMGALQEGRGGDSPVIGVMAGGLCGSKRQGCLRPGALKPEVPVFKSHSVLLAVLLCADYLTSLDSRPLLDYMGVIMTSEIVVKIK